MVWRLCRDYLSNAACAGSFTLWSWPVCCCCVLSRRSFCLGRSVLFSVFTAVFCFFQAEDGIRDGALVTGVQTCALPIYGRGPYAGALEVAHQVDLPAGLGAAGEAEEEEQCGGNDHGDAEPERLGVVLAEVAEQGAGADAQERGGDAVPDGRSEERRVGKEGVSTCSSKW